jgi:hypothetical protein
MGLCNSYGQLCIEGVISYTEEYRREQLWSLYRRGQLWVEEQLCNSGQLYRSSIEENSSNKENSE